ncbi:unnamed protein product, partial [Pylaiella littoralis]
RSEADKFSGDSSPRVKDAGETADSETWGAHFRLDASSTETVPGTTAAESTPTAIAQRSAAAGAASRALPR